MKNPKEYLNITLKQVKEWGWDSIKEFLTDPRNKEQLGITYNAIKQAQIDAYNQALENAVENVEIELDGDTDGCTRISKTDKIILTEDVKDTHCWAVYVDKQSILKLKK